MWIEPWEPVGLFGLSEFEKSYKLQRCLSKSDLSQARPQVWIWTSSKSTDISEKENKVICTIFFFIYVNWKNAEYTLPYDISSCLRAVSFKSSCTCPDLQENHWFQSVSADIWNLTFLSFPKSFPAMIGGMLLGCFSSFQKWLTFKQQNQCHRKSEKKKELG